jgi:hypothetical protein
VYVGKRKSQTDLGRRVKILPGSKAFRAQLVVPEQRQLYDYWLEIAGEAACPARCDLNPARIARLLPGVSLIDICEPLENSKIRLAGTRLREVFDREVTGLAVSDFGWDEKRDYWLEAFERTVRQAEPTQGILQGPMLGKEHMVQYWLKLPLRTTSDAVSMLLCYDFFAPASEMKDIAKAAS